MKKDNGDMTRFSLATSWDDDLVRAVYRLNQNHENRKVKELFGSFQTSVTGSGRPPHRLPFVSHERAQEHIACAHEHGLGFNYTMNAPHLDGKEHDSVWLAQVRRFIADIGALGVDSLTIANPFLIRLIKREFPRFQINLSLIAGVNTVEKAKKYEDMGVDIMNLDPHTINRDFAGIKNIIDAVQCEVELYANIPCLSHCKNRDVHYRLVGNSSKEGYPNEVLVDPIMMSCSLEYLKDPVQLLKSPFIRPEDIPEYNNMGVHIFKLSDRSETTQFLINTAEAYIEQRYEGNLFDLIFRKGRKFKVGVKTLHPEIIDRDIPIVIDNSTLTNLDFCQQLKMLKGKALDDFYEKATARAVKGYGENTQELKTILQSSLDSL